MSAELPVNVYIDGYNFYYAIHRASNRKLSRRKRGWCDFVKLGSRLLQGNCPGTRLGAVKYFTSPVGNFESRKDEERRQQLWLDALREGTNHRVTIVRGFHAKEQGKQRVEKQTDVNIAISIVRDSIMSPEDVADDPAGAPSAAQISLIEMDQCAIADLLTCRLPLRQYQRSYAH